MIVQCTSCRALIDVAHVQKAEGGIHLFCSSCEDICFLPFRSTTNKTKFQAPLKDAPTKTVLLAEEAKGEETSIPNLSAPKEEDSDSNMPLAYAKKDFILEKLAKLPEDEEGIAADFSNLLCDWHDASAHAKLIQRAAMQNALPLLGMRYRLILDEDPDESRAKAAQDQIMTQAMLRMNARSLSRQSATKSNRWSTAAMILMTVIMTGAIWYMVLVMSDL